MKRLISVFALVMMISFMCGCAEKVSYEELFQIDYGSGEYDGFNFSLKDPENNSHVQKGIEDGVFREVIPDIGLYHSDTLEDIEERIPSEDIERININPYAWIPGYEPEGYE